MSRHQIYTIFIFFIFISNIKAQCPTITWSDEFNGTNLDAKSWSYQIGDGCDINLCGWGNSELQYYQSQNVVVSNGTLKITAKREQVGTKQYTSARIRTINKVDIKFGRIEARMKMPIGQGLWPAFWMLPTDNVYGGWPMSGEIDIMEYLGHEPNTTHGTLHFGNAWPNNQSTTKKYVIPEGSFNANFHTYALEWTDQKFTWYIDGYLFATKTRADVAGRWPFDQRFHFLLNLAVGGNWPGNPNSSTSFPQVFEIDYIRVYDKTGLPHLSGPESVVEGSKSVFFKIENPQVNSTYEWTLPNGANIVEGNGTNEIKVNWGSQSGEVKVKVTNTCGEVEYKVIVKTEGALKKRVSLENFDEAALITRGNGTGTFFDNVENSSPNSINDSKLCGEYKRSSVTQYDVLFYSTNALSNVSNLINGTEKFYIDILTNAPVGSQILLQLESSTKATSANYPLGRHSRFVINTTKQNEWERLSFNFLDRPDPAMNNNSVNNIVILFAPNSFTGHAYKLDNFDIYDRSILSSNISLTNHEMFIYPNPLNTEILNIQSDISLESYQIIDMMGKVSKKGALKDTRESYQVDIGQLPKGSYFIKVSNDNGEMKTLSFLKN
jgi:beta-glucanase (GH16 family)